MLNKIIGTGVYVAGIAGNQSLGIIESCYNSGEINCKIGKNVAGASRASGILGVFLGGEIKNVYNVGKLNIFSNGTQVFVGGVSGEARGNIECAYNTGYIDNVNQSSNCYIGELFGTTINNASSSNVFYFANEPIGDNSTSSSVTNKVTSEQLKSDEILNLLNQNGVVWKKDTSNINNGYPIFTWQ